MNNKLIIGDTPEQLNCKMAHIDSALLVDGFVYTEDAVRQLKAERDAFLAELQKANAIILDLQRNPPKFTEQHLAEIRAEAVQYSANSIKPIDMSDLSRDFTDGYEYCRALIIQYAEQIRQGGVK
jgi:hypothetical protein